MNDGPQKWLSVYRGGYAFAFLRKVYLFSFKLIPMKTKKKTPTTFFMHVLFCNYAL